MPYQEDNLIEFPRRPDRKPEAIITPEHSSEVLAKIEKINSGIENSEELLGGLGRVAREQIITDPEALAEIYAPEKIKQDLEKYDAGAFETAGMGLRARNVIKRVLTLGFADSGYALKGYGGELVDKRKLKEENARGPQSLRYSSELEDAIEKFGLDPKQTHSWQDFRKEYIVGEDGAKKIIIREKIAEEADKIAGNIFAKRLKDLEIADGADLVKQKQGLEEFKKLKEQNKDILDEENIQMKLNEEEIARQGMIEEKQEALNSNLEIFRSPLLEQQKGLAQALEGLSSLSKEIIGQEKTYETEIKGLQDKIRRIKGAKPLAEVLGDEIKEWEEQKAQAEVNSKDFKEKKEALNKRIIELKKNQAEVDATLTKINNIGKTKEELKAEGAEKQQAEKEKPEAEKKKNADSVLIVAPAMSIESGASGVGEAVEVAEGGAAQPVAASQTVEKKSETKAKTSKTEAATAAKLTASKSASPEQKKAEASQESKENIKEYVNEWLIMLGIRRFVNSAEKTAVENNFKVVGKKFSVIDSMTLGQVRQAYAKYIVDFRHGGQNSYLAEAQKEANEKLEKIIKNLEE